MPRAREVFVKAYYPEHYDSFLRGKQEGRREGELVGEIQMLQRILKEPVFPKDELFGKNISELQILANTLNTEWMCVDYDRRSW